MSDHNLAFVSAEDGAPVRRGTLSTRFELRDGDCAGSDCGSPRARAEIRQIPGRSAARVGQDAWYGWSFYNETVPAYSADTALRNVFGQWKLSGPTPTLVRLVQLGRGEGNWSRCDTRICQRTTSPSTDLVVQLPDVRTALNWGEAENDGMICKLFSLSARRGQWVDIVLNSNFAPGPDGYLRVWVDGVQRCNYSGPIVSAETLAASDRRPNARIGIFASFTERWQRARPGTPIPTQVVYYDEFREGRSFADVDVRSRQAAGAAPVN